MKRKNLIFFACLLVWIYGCGAIPLLGDKEQPPITKNIANLIDSARDASKKYFINHYSPEIVLKDFRGITDCNIDIPKSSIGQIMLPKHNCRPFVTDMELEYADKKRNIALETEGFRSYCHESKEKFFREYNTLFSNYLDKFRDIKAFLPIYINSIRGHLGYPSSVVVGEPICNFKKLSEPTGRYEAFLDKLSAHISLDHQESLQQDGFILNFNYFYKSVIRWEGQKPAGKDRVSFLFKETGPKVTITITELPGDEYEHIVNLKALLDYIRPTLTKNDIITHEDELRKISELIKSKKDELAKEKGLFESRRNTALGDLNVFLKKIANRVKLVSKVEDMDVYCHLLSKNLKIYESDSDVTMMDIEVTTYKAKNYLSFSFFYLNILNNVNIKLNDQYKIALYLFDHLVRQGVKEFSDCLKSAQIDGIAFEIRATDKNFVNDEKDPNVSLYSFYLPKNKIILYINDDITGKELADSSYILVNGERIHLR